MPKARHTVGEMSIGFLYSLFFYDILKDIVDTLDNCAVQIWEKMVSVHVLCQLQIVTCSYTRLHAGSVICLR